MCRNFPHCQLLLWHTTTLFPLQRDKPCADSSLQPTDGCWHSVGRHISRYAPHPHQSPADALLHADSTTLSVWRNRLPCYQSPNTTEARSSRANHCSPTAGCRHTDRRSSEYRWCRYQQASSSCYDRFRMARYPPLPKASQSESPCKTAR